MIYPLANSPGCTKNWQLSIGKPWQTKPCFYRQKISGYVKNRNVIIGKISYTWLGVSMQPGRSSRPQTKPKPSQLDITHQGSKASSAYRTYMAFVGYQPTAMAHVNPKSSTTATGDGIGCQGYLPLTPRDLTGRAAQVCTAF